jgi:hypothetical protein
MITFPCKCGNIFNVPDDQAGGLVQCEHCKLLADVPRSDDLASLKEDGTFAFEETEPVGDGITLADLHHTFTNRTTDDQGRQKDFRPTADHFERIGVLEETGPVRVAPRYDPETGELIRPLQLKEEEPMPVLAIAVPAGPDEPLTEAPMPVISLGYAVGEARQMPTFMTVAAALFQPVNLTVMLFMLVFYIIAYLARIPLNTFALYLHLPVTVALVPNIFLWIIVAHYGCVVEDTGPDAIDELPRPMRFVDLGDDLFRPLTRFLLAMAICFLPAALAISRLAPSTATAALVAGLFVGGAVLFPAVLLTSLTGTTILNLTPGRVFGVIGVCGGKYLLTVAAAIVSVGLTVVFLLGPASLPALADIPGIYIANRSVFLMPGIVLAIYFSHLFTWHLGVLYREHHDAFPWLAQRHIRRPGPQQ